MCAARVRGESRCLVVRVVVIVYVRGLRRLW